MVAAHCLLQNYTIYKHRTCTMMLLMTCEFHRCQYCKDCNLCSNDTAKKVNFSLGSYWSITLVDAQQHPKVLKSALVIIISCGMEESWGIALMQKCLQKHFQRRYRHCCLKQKWIQLIVNLFGWVTFFFLAQTRNYVRPPFSVTNLPYSLAELPYLCDCSSLRGSVQIYQVSEAHTYTLVDIFSLVGSHEARADWYGRPKLLIQKMHFQNQLDCGENWCDLCKVRLANVDSFVVKKWLNLCHIQLSHLCSRFNVLTFDSIAIEWFAHANHLPLDHIH